MRELTSKELSFVSGAGDQCTPANSEGGNTYGGISDTTTLAQDMINIYEGAVAFTSYVIERVADSLGG